VSNAQSVFLLSVEYLVVHHFVEALARRGTILSMAIEQILALLIQERDKLNQAIEALQGPLKRRGRPPKNSIAVVATSASSAPAKRKRSHFSAAQRAAAAERMRQRWAAKKKAEKRPQSKSSSKPKRTAKPA
jgi:hypothetical protein